MTWNIEEEGFLFRPEGRGAADLQVFIPFKDLKAVFFVKDFDKELARKIKRADIYAKKDRIAVTFRDGERIEGFTMRKFDPKAPRFLMVPKEEPDKEENNICVLVERKFTTEVTLVDKIA